MSLNPYKKGYRGEKQWERKLQSIFPKYKKYIKRIGGTEKHRTTTTGDLYCFSDKCILSRFHLENKQRDRLNLPLTFSKTRDDAKGRPFIIRWKKPNSEPMYIMREKDILQMLKDLQEYEYEDIQRKVERV